MSSTTPPTTAAAAETLSARGLRGLSFAPHHPGLFFVIASACFEFGAVEDAIRLLRHTLWIHPGHTAARRDLESLNSYLQERWNAPGGFTAEEAAAMDESGPFDPELAFEMLEEEGESRFGAYEDETDPQDDHDDEERAA